MNASAQFSDPSDLAVVITLKGTLGEFEKLSDALRADRPVPYYTHQTITEMIGDLSRKLRGLTRCTEPEARND